MKKKYIPISISLLISLFIYLFYRTERTLVNQLVYNVISFDTYSRLKASIASAFPLPDVVIYSLPEGLWVFCITLTSGHYYIKIGGRCIYCLYIPLLFSVALELFQLLHITNGRFDFMDIGISFAFWLLGLYANAPKTEKQDILSRLNLNATICLVSYCVVYLAHVFK